MSDFVWLPKTRKDFDAEKLKTLKAILEKIPEFPVSVQRIIEMTSDSNINPQEIAEVASSDPLLVSRILHMVNSSYYGLNRKIDNLRLAIVLLGFKEVRKIALRRGITHVFDGSSGKSLYSLKKVWVHSYLVSIFAEKLAGDDNPQLAGVLVTMGIMHDIGKFALHVMGGMLKDARVSFDALHDVSHDTHLLKKEESVYGVNHTIIGAMLAEKWGLSERLCAPLEYHHYPSFFGFSEIPPQYVEDVSAISISDYVINHMTGENKLLPKPHDHFFTILGLEPSFKTLVTPELREELMRALEFVKTMA